MKKCPFCAEEIQDEAIICRYCHERLDEPDDDFDLEEEREGPDWVKIGLIGLILVVIGAIIYVFIDRQTDRVMQDITDVLTGSDSRYVTVVYEIRGTADSGMITWMNAQGGIEQQNNARIPWSKTYQMQYGDLLSISVQNSEAEGSVICRIKVDGAVVKQSESSGAYVIAMCSGMVGD